MGHRDRNPWQGLTMYQANEIDQARMLPHRRMMRSVDAWQDIHLEYSSRCAALLCNNDLRGALHAAEIAAAAHHMQASEVAGEQRRAEMRAEMDRQAVENPDPRGELTYVPGKKRRVRVKAASG